MIMEVQYTGEWTNQQLRYAISLLTGEQTSGIYQYQYIHLFRQEVTSVWMMCIGRI